MMSAVSIERHRPEDRAPLQRLYAEVFGEPLAGAGAERWGWQYEQNPATTDGPEIWVAREGDQILGQYASMPVRLWWGDREVRSSWGMDVFVTAAARGKGVGARLFNAWADHVDVALGLGLTPSSYGLFKKLGYEDVGPVPFYRKILDPRAVAARRLGPVLGAIAGPFLSLGLRLAGAEPPARMSEVAVQAATSVGPEHDALWDRARRSYAMCVRRDAPYLEWKYLRCPHRAYRLHEARRGPDLAGFAVSRTEDYRGLRLGWLLDVFAHADDTEAQSALVARVIEDFRGEGVARAQAFSMHAGLGHVLRRHGFFAGPSPMQFCVHTQSASPSVFARKDEWHVVFGDSDMDR
jgi:GNAT superfamily N-acetyltransferase